MSIYRSYTMITMKIEDNYDGDDDYDDDVTYEVGWCSWR